jgi:Ubiquinone biosynthesis protein COQ7
MPERHDPAFHPRRSLTGDAPKAAARKIAAMIRVDHAGEYGAVRIYQGQLDALKGSPAQPIIEHMQAQEMDHLQTFNNLMVQNRVRPSLLNPLWHVAGYALGYVTGKLGERAAMACTVAVEEVIDAHYSEQERYLENLPDQADLQTTITRFRQEELEHRDIGLEHDAQNAPGYELITGVVKTASKLAIWLSKRL